MLADVEVDEEKKRGENLGSARAAFYFRILVPPLLPPPPRSSAAVDVQPAGSDSSALGKITKNNE